MLIISLLLVLAYLVGSIPTGYVFSCLFFNLDITKHGSGNIGATNVARVLGVRYFLLIFLIDASKAFAILYLIKTVQPTIVLYAAMLLMIGNAYSCFLRFTGGKGVATMCGVLAVILPMHALGCFIASWLLVFLVTRRSFLGSLIATVVTVLGYAYCNSTMIDQRGIFLCWLLLFIIWRHKDNIRNGFTCISQH